MENKTTTTTDIPQITCEDLIHAGHDDEISDLFAASLASIEGGLCPDLVLAVIQHAIEHSANKSTN